MTIFREFAKVVQHLVFVCCENNKNLTSEQRFYSYKENNVLQVSSMMKIYFLTKKRLICPTLFIIISQATLKKDGRESCLVVMMKSKKDFDPLHDRYYGQKSKPQKVA